MTEEELRTAVREARNSGTTTRPEAFAKLVTDDASGAIFTEEWPMTKPEDAGLRESPQQTGATISDNKLPDDDSRRMR